MARLELAGLERSTRCSRRGCGPLRLRVLTDSQFPLLRAAVETFLFLFFFFFFFPPPPAPWRLIAWTTTWRYRERRSSAMFVGRSVVSVKMDFIQRQADAERVRRELQRQVRAICLI
jgi:hypothetical protein